MFDKLIHKVSSRRSSDSSLLELASTRSRERRSSVSNPMIVITEDNRTPNEDRSMSLNGAIISPRSRSRSLSVNLGPNTPTRGISSNNPSRGPSPIPFARSPSITISHQPPKKTTKELIKEGTAQVVLKKLSLVLKDLGLQQPIPLKTTNGPVSSNAVSKSTKIFVSNTNDCIYLSPASSASFTYEDVENGNNPTNLDLTELLNNEDIEEVESAILSDEEDQEEVSPTNRARLPSFGTPSQLPTLDPNAKNIPKRLEQKLSAFRSPNYLCTKIDSDTPIPHTFAVIVELTKDSKSVSEVKVEFKSTATLLWPTSDPFTKAHSREKFKIGNLEWNIKLSEADYYISSSNTNDTHLKNLSPNDLAKRTRDYKLVNIRDLADGNDKINDDLKEKPSSEKGASDHKAGLYVFLLPIILPEHIPQSILSINGSMVHNLSVSFSKTGEKLTRRVKVNAEYNLPIVRTPPSFANSIADKPIYVNRVWNDSLHYIITFPRKYVALGAEHVINIKLVPLVKDVIIKRIRFNVLERITYVSKDLSKEYDYDGEDPYHIRQIPENKIKERIISLCELKTKHKATANAIGSEPYKEEVVKCPDNNLLYICYENEKKAPGDKRPAPTSMIASPLDINIALPFLTTKMDKTIMTSSMDEDYPSFSNPTSRKASITNSDFPNAAPQLIPFSPVIGALETNLSHQEADHLTPNEFFTPESSSYLTDDFQSSSVPPLNFKSGYTSLSRALYPDSNFRHIQIHHRLQVCFRISKPDPKDDFKMHHYEVVVDTPLVLVSSKCSDDSVQLPEYEDIYMNESTTEVGDISFRTPNFEKNGLVIKTFDPMETDQLPSFEEATSPISSPITRSFSVSEDPISGIPSLSDQAPSYESVEDASSPLSIDSMVNQSGSGSQVRSRLRNSLASSFAAPGRADVPSEESSTSSVVISDGAQNGIEGSTSDLVSDEVAMPLGLDSTPLCPTKVTVIEPLSAIAPGQLSVESISSDSSDPAPLSIDDTPTTTVAESSIRSQEELNEIEVSKVTTQTEVSEIDSCEMGRATFETDTTEDTHATHPEIQHSPREVEEINNVKPEMGNSKLEQTLPNEILPGGFPEYHHPNETNTSLVDSIIEEESSFVQRLPLLLFVSSETIPTKKNYKYTSTSTLPSTAEEINRGKYLTDNLSILSTNQMYGIE